MLGVIDRYCFDRIDVVDLQHLAWIDPYISRVHSFSFNLKKMQKYTKTLRLSSENTIASYCDDCQTWYPSALKHSYPNMHESNLNTYQLYSSIQSSEESSSDEDDMKSPTEVCQVRRFKDRWNQPALEATAMPQNNSRKMPTKVVYSKENAATKNNNLYQKPAKKAGIDLVSTLDWSKVYAVFD